MGKIATIAINSGTKSEISRFAKASLTTALLILLADITIYVGAVVTVVVSDSMIIKAASAGLAGFMISQLFVVAHDAAHQAFVPHKKLNAIIARLCFLPSLHNYSLWLYVHNQIHHAYPNVKGYNSWSPISLDEFNKLPKWRQWVERLYRSPLGFGPYYIVERWFKEKIYPKKHIPRKYHQRAWKDTVLLLTYFIAFSALVVTPAYLNGTSMLSAWLWAFLVPFIVWNYAVGMTIYLHHTHQSIKWYESLSEWKKCVPSQVEVTSHVKYPLWYNIITHNIYLHPVHHVNPKIPLYQLKQAQQILEQKSINEMHVYKFGLQDMLKTISACKLYNFEVYQWLDFHGNITGDIQVSESVQARKAV